VEIKCQLDATDEFLLQILLLAQHVSGTIMPIIRSSSVASSCHFISRYYRRCTVKATSKKAAELLTWTFTLAYVTPVKKTTPIHQNASSFKDLPWIALDLDQQVSTVSVVFINALRNTLIRGRGGVVVKVLRYKPAGRGFDCVIVIFQWHNPSGRTMALGLTQPLTEMSTRFTSWG
jgi:hypothetical protein